MTDLRLELRRSDAQQAALLDLLRAQRTPGNNEYRKWLTPEQFAERFGPGSTEQANALVWLQQHGFQATTVTRNGMRIRFSGTLGQVQRAFGIRLLSQTGVAHAALMVQADHNAFPSAALTHNVRGLQQGDEAGALASLASAVDLNSEAAVVIPPPNAVGDDQSDRQELLAEAAAQGITVLQQGGGTTDSADAGVAILASIAGGESGEASSTARPDWQVASGLPADGLRAVPDAIASAQALADAINSFAAQHGRVGALGPTLYALAIGHRIFSHPTNSAAEGVWTPMDGLGTLDVRALMAALAAGTTPATLALTPSGFSVTHGSTLSLNLAVSGSSTPTGTVTATLKGRSGSTVTLGPTSLGANGAATLSTNTLAGDVYDISGSYSGDSTYAAASSNTATTTVTPENVALTATATGATLGGTIPVTVTATSPSGVGVPSGTVTVTTFGLTSASFTAALPASPTSSATAVVNVAATELGKITLQATCASNGSFNCSQPATLTATVAQATPTVLLTSTAQALASNSATQKYNLAVSVAAPSGSSMLPAPTGTVDIQDNGITVTTLTLNKGASTYTLSLSGTGHSLTAVYNGDTNYAGATSAAVPVNAPLIATTTSLAASPTAITFSATTSLTASVTPAAYAASGAPTGTVTLRDSLQGVIGTATLANGYVTVTADALTVGTHNITAVYGGDTNYSPSTSSVVTVTVAQGKVATITTLLVSPAQPLAGQLTTLTAAVAPTNTALNITCTGQVTFFSNNVFVANGVLSGGKVSVPARLAPGSDSLTAVYGGDAQCFGSTSSALTVSPARIASALTLQSSVSYANAGQTIQLKATVGPADATLSGTPTGTITFYGLRGGVLTPLGTAVLTSTGLNSAIATLNVDGSTAGQQSFSATYGGDPIFLPSTSSTIVVSFGDFGLSFSPGSLTISRGSSGTASATVSVNSGFSGPVVLSCVPPASSLMTCSFLPATITGGGTSVLMVKAAATSAKNGQHTRLVVAGAGFAALLFLPLARTRRVAAVLLLLCCYTAASGGCSLSTVDSTNNLNSGSGSSPASGGGGTTTTGTPLGTQFLSITASSGDGTLRHTYSYSVTVQ